MINQRRPVYNPDHQYKAPEVATLPGDEATRAFQKIHEALRPVVEAAQKRHTASMRQFYSLTGALR